MQITTIVNIATIVHFIMDKITAIDYEFLKVGEARTCSSNEEKELLCEWIICQAISNIFEVKIYRHYDHDTFLYYYDTLNQLYLFEYEMTKLFEHIGIHFMRNERVKVLITDIDLFIVRY